MTNDVFHGAIITPIATAPHSNADRLQLGYARGLQIVVGLDIKDGDVGILFRDDLQLSDSFCLANSLYPLYDDEGNRIGGGFFDPNKRRVRAQKFRGERSEGFWCPLSYLDSWASYLEDKELIEAVSNLKVGDCFSELADVELCRKYITKKTRNSGGKNRQIVRKNNPFFRQHVDTDQWAYNWDKIPDGSTLYISEKLEGRAARYAHVPTELPKRWYITWLLRALGWLLRAVRVLPKGNLLEDCLRPVETLVGSRRVELRSVAGGFDNCNKAYFKPLDKLEGVMHYNEVIFGELVGWGDKDTPLRPAHDITKLKEKKLTKRYGKGPMYYKYGLPQGECELWVYRVTYVHEDGSILELTDKQARDRAKRLGLRFVPMLAEPMTVSRNTIYGILAAVEQLAEGSSSIDDSHLREGVVIRVELPDNKTYFLKHKQFAYKVLEGIIKDDDDYVDEEEVEV